MEAIWVREAKERDFLRETKWSQNWARMVSDSFASGLETVKGYQRRRQTLYEVLIIVISVGILANLLVQALLPGPLPAFNTTLGRSPPDVPAVGVVSVLMVILVIVYLMVQKRYGPRTPAAVSVHLDYDTLLKSVDKRTQDAIGYLMDGAGVRDFEGFAKRVLRRTMEFIQAVPLRSNLLEITESVQTHIDYPPSVTLSGELSAVASHHQMQGVIGKLMLTLHPTMFFEQLVVAKVELVITTSLKNPENPLADDFLTQVIRPMLPLAAEGFSNSFWTELPISSIMQLRDLIRRVHEYKETHKIADDWYLMNYCPFDGVSKTMVVIDRSIVSKELLENPIFGENPILSLLNETGLYGSYVTDSNEWISADDYKQFFGVSHHLSDEMIFVRPTKIVTIGPKSKSCVLKHLEHWHEKLEVISVLETAPKSFSSILEVEGLINELSEQISAKLKLSKTSTLQ